MLNKRLEFGFAGYQIPITPQATRSARKRPVFRKNLEPESPDGCAFDLLATVAGNILLEQESLEKNGEKTNETILNLEIRDRGSCSKNFPSQFTSDDEEKSSGCTQLKNITVIESMDKGSSPSQKNYPFKKRKSFYCSNSDGGVTSEAIPSPPETSRKYNGVAQTSCSTASQSRNTESSSLKLKIKSFKVPELFISVPETATVGFLKKTVMEAVSSLLGGGMQVDVLLRDKKVGDDDQTLLQTGISRNYKPDSLNFILEPNPPPLSDSASSQPLTRFPAEGNMVNFSESDGDSEIRVMVAVPDVSMEALTLIPLQQKAKKPDTPQRRVRRPFSVSEVEALVQAVETLGTGRWRDVKLHAFFHAKHRTYVDLKDKWKTLVHTARISPQQRRGEPVPQELLDRVLVAHSYWSQQHRVVPETRLLLGSSS